MPATVTWPTSRCRSGLNSTRLVRQPRRWMYGAVAATLAAFVCGGGVGWVARGVTASPLSIENLTSDALDAHRLYVVEVRHPVEVQATNVTTCRPG